MVWSPVNAPAEDADLSAVAVWGGAHLFVLTGATDELALRLAEAVKVELVRVP